MDTALETKLTSTPFRRDPEEITPWSETCGAIRCLIEESDLAAAEVHHVKIHIIDGEGKLVLDDKEVAVKKGVVVYVPRGVKHKAVGDLTVLTVCIPRGVLDDVHEVE